MKQLLIRYQMIHELTQCDSKEYDAMLFNLVQVQKQIRKGESIIVQNYWSKNISHIST